MALVNLLVYRMMSNIGWKKNFQSSWQNFLSAKHNQEVNLNQQGCCCFFPSAALFKHLSCQAYLIWIQERNLEIRKTANTSSVKFQLKSRNSARRKPKPHALEIRTVVNTHLAEIGVQLADAVAELFNILSEKLVSIRDSVVKVAHLVVSESPQVFLVEIVAQSGSKSQF